MKSIQNNTAFTFNVTLDKHFTNISCRWDTKESINSVNVICILNDKSLTLVKRVELLNIFKIKLPKNVQK